MVVDPSGFLTYSPMRRCLESRQEALLTRMVPAADFFFTIFTASDSGSLGGMISRSHTIQYESNDISLREGERDKVSIILTEV